MTTIILVVAYFVITIGLAQMFKDQFGEAQKYGVKSMVDATPINLGRDTELLKKAADASGANILVTTGFYYYEYPWVGSLDISLDPNMMAEWILKEVDRGIQGTNIKPAQIKCATDTACGYSNTNHKMIKAAGIAAKASGLPVITHTNSKDGKCGIYQQDILVDECGVDAHRIYIGHAFDGADPDYIEKIIKKGSYVGCDRSAYAIIQSIDNVAATLIEICKRGYSDHVFLSHDV